MDERTMQSPENMGQMLSPKEIELLRQLIHSRSINKQDLAYEELDEYEVPPRTQFSMLKKPAVTIKDGHINFNMASIRLFENVQYVLPVVNEKKRRLAVIPCQEEEASSIDWARKKADDTWTNKEITNRDLVSKIGAFMKWNTNCRYKILGEVRMSQRGPILVFELDEAIMFSKQDVEYQDKDTGEIKIKKKDVKYYPEKYRGKIGMSYSDYAETRQISLFEDFANYFSMDGTSVPETAKEEQRTNAPESEGQIIDGAAPLDAFQRINRTDSLDSSNLTRGW